VTVIRSAEDQARDEQRDRATDQLNQDSLAIQKALLRVSDRQLATAIASRRGGLSRSSPEPQR
jgi:hypothetical protein